MAWRHYGCGRAKNMRPANKRVFGGNILLLCGFKGAGDDFFVFKKNETDSPNVRTNEAE